jgi:hypothetical protein
MSHDECQRGAMAGDKPDNTQGTPNTDAAGLARQGSELANPRRRALFRHFFSPTASHEVLPATSIEAGANPVADTTAVSRAFEQTFVMDRRSLFKSAAGFAASRVASPVLPSGLFGERRPDQMGREGFLPDDRTRAVHIVRAAAHAQLGIENHIRGMALQSGTIPDADQLTYWRTVSQLADLPIGRPLTSNRPSWLPTYNQRVQFTMRSLGLEPQVQEFQTLAADLGKLGEQPASAPTTAMQQVTAWTTDEHPTDTKIPVVPNHPADRKRSFGLRTADASIEDQGQIPKAGIKGATPIKFGLLINDLALLAADLNSPPLPDAIDRIFERHGLNPENSIRTAVEDSLRIKGLKPGELEIRLGNALEAGKR